MLLIAYVPIVFASLTTLMCLSQIVHHTRNKEWGDVRDYTFQLIVFDAILYGLYTFMHTTHTYVANQ